MADTDCVKSKLAVCSITCASIVLFIFLIVFTYKFCRNYGNKNKLISLMLVLLNFYLFLRIINLSTYVVIAHPPLSANFLSEVRVRAQSGTSTVQELRTAVSAVLRCGIPLV